MLYLYLVDLPDALNLVDLTDALYILSHVNPLLVGRQWWPGLWL